MAGRSSGVRVYDPESLENVKKTLGDDFHYVIPLVECVDSSDIFIIAAPWPEFKEFPDHELQNSHNAVVLIEGWNMVTVCEFSANVSYTVLGKGTG